MNINTVDLNLLKVFAALYKERNVSQAGERIGLAQSSMSNALSRLRNQFDDQLFQRTPKGMEPTARAEELAPMVDLVLDNVGKMLTQPTFDPSSVSERIVIAAPDLSTMTIAPKLMAKLREKAPGIQLNFVPQDKQRLFSQLDTEEIQMAVGTFSSVPARFHRLTLKTYHFVCIARDSHPQINKRLTLKRYTELQHLLMTLNADNIGVIDSELKKLGTERNIAMTCAQFSPLIEVVATTDLIATVPSLLEDIATRAGCKVYPLPFEMPEWSLELIVSQKFYASALGKFIIEQIRH